MQFFPKFFKNKRFAYICAVLFILITCRSGFTAQMDRKLLETGFRQMYDLEFPAAHRTFETWKHDHPTDPFGPVSNAAAYLFAEFERLRILDSDFLAERKGSDLIEEIKPDLKVKSVFESELSSADDLSAKILAENPEEPDALFAKLLSDGLRGDYVALIEKRKHEALSLLKSSRITAEKLLAIDPQYSDAYLAIGIENYVLGLHAAPTRWLLRLSGAETDRQKGLASLEITAESGRYLAPFARTLLTIVAFRDQDFNKAQSLLTALVREFPGNRLYKQELIRLQDNDGPPFR